VIRFIIESIARDGNVAINIPIKPDGSLEEKCVKMLEKMGKWLDLNGEAVYGSRAWKIMGEGEMVDGHLKVMPGGYLGPNQAEFLYTAEDIRFTVGKDDSLYAFCMALPAAGQKVLIKSLAKDSDFSKIKSVSLLGYDSKLNWRQTAEGLEIEYPQGLRLSTAAVFKIKR
jgi:alpha-L-fucosidase